jgi:hypothetical protein
MLVLGIETTCDETAAAVVDRDHLCRPARICMAFTKAVFDRALMEKGLRHRCGKKEKGEEAFLVVPRLKRDYDAIL